MGQNGQHGGELQTPFVLGLHAPFFGLKPQHEGGLRRGTSRNLTFPERFSWLIHRLGTDGVPITDSGLVT